MEPTKYREAFERAYPIVEQLRAIDPQGYLTVAVGGEPKLVVNFFPSDEIKEEAVRLGLKLFGKLTKDKNGNLTGEKDGVTANFFSVLKCEIVGYKTERRPKVITTGEYVETQIPIYECRSPIAQAGVETKEEAPC